FLFNRAYSLRLHADVLRSDAALGQGNQGSRERARCPCPRPRPDRRSGAVRAEPDRCAAGALAGGLRVLQQRRMEQGVGSGALETARDTRRIMDKLEAQHPGADTELHHRNAFELLVATILSAQSTDRRVNLVTPALFARYPDARALAGARTRDLEARIRSTGFYHAKATS